MNQLSNAGVKYYDFRKMLHDEGMNHHKAFYITDHHWKAETGFWAARHILKFLHDDFNWNVNPDVLDENNFDFKIYRDWFLGSQGKKVTLARTNPENISLIYPKFNTMFHYEIPSLEINKVGDFSITYDMSQIKERNFYEKNPYAAYNYGDKPFIKIENKLLGNKERILIIKNSLANCVIPFLALGIENVEAIDLRYFTGSLKKYIELNKPDLVIVLYNPSEFKEKIDYKTHKDLFDFR